MGLKTRKRPSLHQTHPSFPSQTIANRDLIDRPLDQREIDDNFIYLEDTKQPIDDTLLAIADSSEIGFITKVSDTLVHSRTLVGEADRIIIADGGGVNQNPTFTIGTDIVTLNGVQVLTNKTIDANFNTILNVNAHTLDGFHEDHFVNLNGSQVITNKYIDGYQNTLVHLHADIADLTPEAAHAGKADIADYAWNSDMVDGWHVTDILNQIPPLWYTGIAYMDAGNVQTGTSIGIVVQGTVFYFPASTAANGLCHSNCHVNCHSAGSHCIKA